MDVITKSIFRQAKSYYVEDFKKTFHFNKRVRRVNFNHSDEVYKMAEQYINKKFSQKSDDLHLIFVGLVDSREMYTRPHRKFPQWNSESSCLLRAFNKKKSESMLEMKEFSYLLLHYMELPEWMDEIQRSHSQPKIRQAYLAKLEELRKACLSTLWGSSARP